MKIVENRKYIFALSLIVMLAAAVFGIYNYATGKGAFNLDVDFSGGTSLQYDLQTDAEVADIESVITGAIDVQSPRVQKILGTTNVVIQLRKISAEERDKLTEALSEKYPGASLLSFSDVSSTVSGEMQNKALTAVLIACGAMLIYITFRFKDFKMGASAIVALMHDMLIMLAVYIIFRVPVNNSFIAAILTILGYSINATIIVFDRIRENRKFVKSHQFEHLINASINQTIARSINTSLTTLITITCVYIFGVTSVRDFAFPLIIGIVSGTYSSVFFAGSVWYSLCVGNTAKSVKKPVN